MSRLWQGADAAVVFVCGQSNAHAHNQFLPQQERITEPLGNVWAPDREPNQREDITDIVFTGYTTAGKNLGETQDHTACFAYYLAKKWQAAVDNGAPLPDLYIVQNSIGSQGIINGMWNRDKAMVLHPGDLQTADIALYPWSLKVNRLVMAQLRRRFARPVALGLHWIGSEQDTCEGGYDHPELTERYDAFFDTMLQALGQPCPLCLYKSLMAVPPVVAPVGPERINRELARQHERHPLGYLIGVDQHPAFDEAAPHRGVYDVDDGHYRPFVQEWFADRFWQWLELPE